MNKYFRIKRYLIVKIGSNCPNNSLYQEYKVYYLLRIPRKGKTTQKFNGVGINKVGDFIKIYDKDLVYKEKLLDTIMHWMMRGWNQTWRGISTRRTGTVI